MNKSIAALISATLLTTGCTSFSEHGIYMSDDVSGKGHWSVTRIEQYPDPLRLQATVVTRHVCDGKHIGELAPDTSAYYGCVLSASNAYSSSGWLLSVVQPAMIAAGIFAAGYEIGHMPASRVNQSSLNVNNPNAISNSNAYSSSTAAGVGIGN